MDVPALLVVARRRAGLSQRQLAEQLGVTRPAVAAYERGAKSPTVRTLDRLLAGCGLQARVLLEPLGAHLEAQVDAVLAQAPPTWEGEDLACLEDLIASLAEHPEVDWAFDGATALQLQALAVPASAIGVVAVENDALRFWLRAARAVGTWENGGRHLGWLDTDREMFDRLAWTAVLLPTTQVALRVVTSLPQVLRLRLPGIEQDLPVLGLAEVEQAHPALAELLAGLRRRRSLGG